MEDVVELDPFSADDETAPAAAPGAAAGPARRPPLYALGVRALQAASALTVWKLCKLYFAQTGLILPGRLTQGQPCARFDPPTGAELVPLRAADGNPITALYGPATDADDRPLPDAADRPFVLFFYGNLTCLSNSVPLFKRLRRMGANVLIPEYVGFGLSGGAAGERGCYATADAAYRFLREQKGIGANRIVAAGASLGGAVAIDLASRKPVAGLITLITFSSIADMARLQQPNVPIWRFIRHRFESVKKMPSVTCPALIVHSTGDSLVPIAMAHRLAAAAGGPVTQLTIEGADHRSTEVLDVGGDTIFRAVEEFLSKLGQETAATPG